MDRGAWRAMVRRLIKSQTQLHIHTHFLKKLIRVVESPIKITNPDSKRAISRLSLGRFLAFNLLRTLIFL